MSVQKQIDRLLSQRAAEWFEVYRTGQEDKYSEVIVWLTESPRHMAEFLEIARRYPDIREVLRSGAFDLEALLERAHHSATPIRAPFVLAGQEVPRRKPRWRWAVAIAATLLLGGIVLWLADSARLISHGQHYETQVGEQRVIQLLDGSVMTLNAQSRIDVRFDDAKREVHLSQGEALFKVAHDSARPFWVHTQGAAVRAVGTQFNVYARPDGSTTIAVLEGRVEVSPEQKRTPLSTVLPQVVPASKAAPIPLAAGQAARVGRTGAIQRNDHADLSSAMAWRQRRLAFDRTPLEEIVREFDRYNRSIKVRLENVKPGEYHYTGSFDADDPQSLALLLSKESGLIVEQHEGEILVRGREPAGE